MPKVTKLPSKNGSKPRAVPLDLLDQAVRSYKLEREKELKYSYGADQFTTYEIESIRNRLADSDAKLAGVPIDDLRRQIINRRKQGAYPSVLFPRVKGNGKQKKLKESPQWYKDYLKSAWWRSFRKVVFQFWGYRCALCGKPEGEGENDRLEIHHNQYYDEKGSLLGREEIRHVICLCGECHGKHHADLPSVPDIEPEPLD